MDNVNKFISHVKQTCIRHKVKYVQHISDNITDASGLELGGWFQDSPRELHAAYDTINNSSLGLIAHEYNHMMQWIEHDPVYTREYYRSDPFTMLEDWINGKEYCDQTLKGILLRCLACEIDCDKRVLLTIDEFKLPIKKATYIKNATVCYYFYHYAIENRNWNTTNSMYTPEILELMPKTLDADFTIYPSKIRRLFNSVLGKNNS